MNGRVKIDVVNALRTIATGLYKKAQATGYIVWNREQAENEANKIRSAANAARKHIRQIKQLLGRHVSLEDEAEAWRWMESDPEYFNILVGGANAGGEGFFGMSDLPFGVLATGNNRKLFRHNQGELIEKEINERLSKGEKLRVFGHGWGGATIARMADKYPDAQFYAMDPVSWTGRISKTPKNLTIFYPKPESESNPDIPITTRLAPILGGRWPRKITGDGKILEYEGDHITGISNIINNINYSGMKKQWEPIVRHSH